MQPVKSSAISHIGYDPAAKQMTIRFRNGGEHVYYDVPQEEHEALVGARSIGRHYAERVRNRYTSVPVPAAKSKRWPAPARS